jgi:apolipoprotein N-acyltransferase
MIDSSLVKNYFPAFLTGLLLWCGSSFQGMGWPVLLFALIPLFLSVRRCSLKTAVLSSLMSGMVYYLLLLYWIIIVLGRYGGLGWYISFPTLCALCLYLSAYFISVVVAFRFLAKNCPAFLMLFLVPSLWVGLDWLRSFLFSGFPWMDLGYNLWNFPKFIQIADLVGHHGLTFLIVLINILFVFLVVQETQTKEKLILCVPVLLILGGAAMYSLITWKNEQKGIQLARTTHIGVVQGNIDQSRKWLAEEQRKTVLNYLGQTDFLYQESQVDLFVWPETALPFYPTNNTLTTVIRTFMAKKNGALLTGSPWYEIKNLEKREIEYYNSGLLFQSDGNFGQRYYKSHLVPFGEYVPMKKFLFFLAPLVEAVGDFSHGKIEKPIEHGEIRAGVLICFESIFPQLAREWVNQGANVLINLTNDAWYGKSSAPYQSFAMSVFRAVETRRSLVRSANTGISGFVDPLGRVLKSSDIFVPWAGAAEVPLFNKQTVAVRYGYLFAPLCLLFAGLLTCYCWWKQRYNVE